MSRHRHRPRHDRQRPGGAAGGTLALYGIHAVEAALLNPRRAIQRLLVTDNAAERLAKAIASRGIAAIAAEPKDIDRELPAGSVHQGALATVLPLDVPALADLAPGEANGPDPILIVLDQVTDPHNAGAILRTAAAFGAAGLVMTDRNSPPLASALAKAASGGLEHVPVVQVTNLARALEELAELGFFRIGLDGAAADALETGDLNGPTALILGAEDSGMRRLTRESCDRLARLATMGPIRSLNVSNAAAIALHTVRLVRSLRG